MRPSGVYAVGHTLALARENAVALHCVSRDLGFYFEEMRVFQAGKCLEYVSME